MGWIGNTRRALVIAPHPDDEVLGCGGTIARLADSGCEVEVLIVTRGKPPRFKDADAQCVRRETEAAHAVLGVKRTRFADFPAAELDCVAHADLNRALADLVADAAPDTLFLPFIGDIHLDHQLVFTAGLVAARPTLPSFPARVLAYETLSETNWYAAGITPGFCPNVYVDISDHCERKLAAFAAYRSQVRPFPHERSVEALRALALLRGATVQRSAAEAFMLIREIG